MEEREIRLEPEDWAEALAATSGHQMVVAGPGTGKTEFLVRRVTHLVDSGVARRDEIVVLCFSRRAAADLRRRIERSIGITGVPVDVTTFHSLALRLLETTAGGGRPTPLTTPEQVALVADLLRQEDPTGWPLVYRGILDTTVFAAEVADFFLRCSERLLTPSDLEAMARERADWRALPGLLGRYLTALHDSGRADYGSLLTAAVEILATAEGRGLADRYRFTLVDEYQDTSPAQAEIARLLSLSHGNLTVAGDPYQSIYSFRGAELRNIATFSSAHPDVTRWVLARSFRVPTGIMESALRVVSPGHLPGAAGPVEPAPHAGRCETYIFDQETAEAEWIAREVEQAIRVDGIEPSAIAVLVRSKKELLSELSRALERRSIPHDPPESRLVDHPAIRLIHDILIVAREDSDRAGGVAGSDADRAARRVLLGPLVGLSLGNERGLLRERRRNGRPWAELIEEAIPGSPGLAALLSTVEWARERQAVDGFWHMWSTLDGVAAMVADPERRDWRGAWTSFAQVLARQSERDPGMSLERFFDLVEEEDFEATPLMTYRPTDARVTVTTLHQAKGLEFDLVFIANAVEGVFPDLRRSRRLLRPELLSPDRTTDAGAQHLFQLQEEMRLAYTAMTRARLRVIWTATDAGVDQGERRPSRFLIAAAGDVSLSDIGPPPERYREPVTLAEAETSLRRTSADPEATAMERLAALEVLTAAPGAWWDPGSFPGVPAPGPDSPILDEELRLSPSQADSYSRCPRLYALERRLRLGDSGSPYAHFGTLVHAALEMAEQEVIGSGRLHATVERALQCVDLVWEDADFGSESLDEAWRQKAIETVTRLYESWPNPNGEPIGLEIAVDSTIEGVPWRGRVDRVEDTGEGLRVVDYKTSASAVAIDDAAVSIQLAFYARATAEKLGRPVAEAQFWYPRARGKSVPTRSLEMGRLADVEETMAEVTRSIRSEQWPPRPGGHCERCDFRLSCPAWPEGRGAFLP